MVRHALNTGVCVFARMDTRRVLRFALACTRQEHAMVSAVVCRVHTLRQSLANVTSTPIRTDIHKLEFAPIKMNLMFPQQRENKQHFCHFPLINQTTVVFHNQSL